MIFRIYDAASGGTLLWTETRDDVNRVTVTNGLFSVKLGEVTALSASTFSGNASLYFEIQLATPATATCSVSGCATYEAPMTPRSQLATSAYAFNATNAETAGNATSLGGVAAASYARLDVANSFAGANTFNSTVLGSVNSTTALMVQNTSATPFLTVDTSSAAGEVQIGSATGDANGIQLVLDASSAEPAGINGGMYYNTNLTTNRCHINSQWQDCLPRVDKLTGDVSNNTTTLADVTGLNFAILANTDYVLECDVTYQTAAIGTGIRISLNGPAAPSQLSASFMTPITATTLGGTSLAAYNGGTATTGVAAANTNTNGQFRAMLRNGATAGTLQLRFNSEVGASNVTIKAGTTCKLTSV